MGGAGLASPSAGIIDNLNPASLAAISRTRYSFGVLYEGYSSSDGTNSAFLSNADFEGAAIAIPLSPERGITIGAGISPVSKVSYDVATLETQGGYSYTLSYSGDGGLSAAHLGISSRLGNTLLTGFEFNYLFGTLRHSTNQQFSGNAYTSAEGIRTMRLNGVSVSFGTVFTGLGSMLQFSKGQHLNLGVVLSARSSMNSQEERYYKYTTGAVTTRDTVFATEDRATFPFGFALGLAYNSPRFTIAADYSQQQWGDVSPSSNGVGFRNSSRLSGGMEYIPSLDAEGSFSQRLAYRFGLFHHKTYLQVQGEPINETGITGGFGIPMVGDIRLNLGVEYSIRGTNDNGLQKDRILRISFTLSGSELWFVRPPEE